MARNRRQAGFMLVEVLVVVVIIAIVGSLATIATFHALDKARQRSTLADMRSIAAAVESYEVEHEAPPRGSAITDLVAVLTPRYARELPTRDHWNHTMAYVCDGTGGYTLESLGKDGIEGDNISISTRFDFNLDIVLADGRFVASPE